MEENQSIATYAMGAYGTIGMVYATQEGTAVADPRELNEGWLQASPTMRVLVKSRDNGDKRVWDKRLGARR